MNKLALCAALVCGCTLFAIAQEPPGCEPTKTSKTSRTKKNLRTASSQKSELKGTLPKRRVLDLRKNKSKPVNRDQGSFPVIASPIYLPQTGGSASAAITASNGFLYVVVGQKLYKVNEKTLKTVQVSALGRSQETPRLDVEPTKRRTVTKKPTSSRTSTSKTSTSKTKKKLVVRAKGDSEVPRRSTRKRDAIGG